MTDRDSVKMEINIAGENIQLTVPFNRQDAVRDTERDVNALFDNWRQRFPRKQPTEILAMVAYQYASFYSDLREKYERAADTARSADKALQALLDS